jgi:hypothetical protein
MYDNLILGIRTMSIWFFALKTGCDSVPDFWCKQGLSALADFLPLVLGLCTKIRFRLSFSSSN